MAYLNEKLAQAKALVSGVGSLSNKYIYTTPKSTKPKETKFKESGYTSQDTFINDYLNSLGIKPSGGGASASGAISAYNQAANADIAETKFGIATQKQDLATQVARLRENINTSKAQKAQEYQGTRADIEEAGFMATRANRASAAARGLSGSGLEQLSQIQQMMKQNQAISKAAGSNQVGQDALTKTLTQGEQDYGTNVQNLTKAEQIAISKIQANLAANKASAIQSAASSNSASSANYQAALQENRLAALGQYQTEVPQAQSLFENYKTAVKSGSKKDVQAAAAAITGVTGISPTTRDTLIQNYKAYKKAKGSKY